MKKSKYTDTQIVSILKEAEALGALAEQKPGLGFWKLYRRLRRQGYAWNHKRVYGGYCLLKPNLRRRPKKRMPPRNPMSLLVPQKPNHVWSADFMSDALYNGVRFRTFNMLHDFNREALRIEIDTSLPSHRLVRVTSFVGQITSCPKAQAPPRARLWRQSANEVAKLERS